MKKTMVLSVLVLMATSAWAGTTNYVFPETFTTNPQGEWALYCGTDIATMTFMTSVGSGWFRNTSGNRPSFNEYGGEFRLGEPDADNSAYLVFTCPQTGNYSLDLSIKSWMQYCFSPGIKSYLEVYTSAGSSPIWSSATPWSTEGSFDTNLRAIPELQQMALAANDKIIIRFGLDNDHNYSQICWQLNASGLTAMTAPNIIFGEPTQYRIPSSITSNPQNNWGLYYGPDKNNLMLMTQSDSVWLSNGTRPTYMEYGSPVFRVSGMAAANNAYYIFTCPQTGKYSMNFRVLTDMQFFFTANMNTHYAVYTSLSDTPVFTYTLPWTGTGSYPLEYWFVPEMQEMQLTAGDKIIMMFGIDNTQNYDQGVFSFEANYNTPGIPPSITFVPFVPVVNIPGDANGDGKVDVSDLGILAANYGGTGKTWAQGDFTGDGKVDVSDLGILAAHYGTGTGGSLDFNRDAKAFGLVVDGDGTAAQKSDDPATSTLGCGSAGLPLVAGILLASLLLVGLKMKD